MSRRDDVAASALERAALRVLDEARRSGSVTVKAREDLAEALGLPREAARGRWHGWHGGTGEAAAKERLEREWGDRYEQDAKDEASAANTESRLTMDVPILGWPKKCGNCGAPASEIDFDYADGFNCRKCGASDADE